VALKETVSDVVFHVGRPFSPKIARKQAALPARVEFGLALSGVNSLPNENVRPASLPPPTRHYANPALDCAKLPRSRSGYPA